jgi:hypothetical protein
MKTKTFRYVPHHLAEDYCRLGWMPLCALDGTVHGYWSVLMVWLCDCRAFELCGSADPTARHRMMS